MTLWQLALRSLRHFRRAHLGVVAGVACAAAVLVGALAVGDSVRGSLREQALQRIGRVDAVLAQRERFFRDDLGERLTIGWAELETAAALQLAGTVSVGGGAARAGIVDVFGVDEDFFALGPEGEAASTPAATPSDKGAFLNVHLARHLGVAVGDSVLIRVEKPSALPREGVMATIDDVAFALRVEVEAIVDDASFGRFSLRASQVPPFNVFLSRRGLQDQLDLDGRANLLLVAAPSEGVAAAADDALRYRWSLADAELELERDGSAFSLTSGRVFLDAATVDTARDLVPGSVEILTYFVNQLRHGERATPYSMVSAVGAAKPEAVTEPALRDLLRVVAPAGEDGIVLNEWCAKDLQAAVGDRIELDYFVMGDDLRLREESHAFTVRAIVPLDGAAADPSLSPAFPGLEDKKDCRDWEPGIPVELDRIRDVDEEYWDAHGGTPKAFVDLAVGRRLWQNRYGSATALCGPASSVDALETSWPVRVDPARLGFSFQDVRGAALASGTSATDFGGLFLGLSFFLIVSALLLTSLLFTFGVERRAQEIGTLLAVGFAPRRVRRLWLLEALLLAVVGSVVGAGLGLLYTQGVLWGLGTLWRDAVGATTLAFHASPLTLVIGVVASIVTAVGAIALSLRKAFDRPAVELLGSRQGFTGSPVVPRSRWLEGVGIGVMTAAVVAAMSIPDGSAAKAGAFFGIGALVLVLGLLTYRAELGRADGRVIASVGELGTRNLGRRRGRSLAVVGLLASGTFLVLAVQAYRLTPPSDASVRASGTGGFALYGRSTLPVLRDLDTAEGRAAYGLEDDELTGVAVVGMRVRDGDDASCLNLNLPQSPRLLGVRAPALAAREAFRFASVPAAHTDRPWLSLDADLGPDVVPAIGDQASVTWTLHKAVGDELDYRDESGRTFRVRIVATLADSILQGNLLIAERAFAERFPSASGYRAFLIDAPAERASDVATTLSRAFEDVGLEVTETGARLQAFQAVQNTYLLIFQALGGLGLVLGSFGLGMVVLRNALERRAELALLGAVGFPLRTVRGLLVGEHVRLLGRGLWVGAIAAFVAILPGVWAGRVAWVAIAVLLVAIAVSGSIWVLLAARSATRGPLLEAMRDE